MLPANRQTCKMDVGTGQIRKFGLVARGALGNFPPGSFRVRISLERGSRRHRRHVALGLGAFLVGFCLAAIALPVRADADFDIELFGNFRGQGGYVNDKVDFVFPGAVTGIGDVPDLVGRYRADLEIRPTFNDSFGDYGASIRIFSTLNTAYDHRRGVSEFDNYPFYYDRFRREEAIDFDRLYLFLGTDYGTIQAGWVNGISDQTAVTAPADWGTGGADGDFRYFVDLPVDVGFTALRAFTSANPSPRINYHSPRYAGLQVGFGFQPNTRNSGFEFDYRTKVRGIRGRRALSSGSFEGTTAGYRNVYEIGVNYETRFGPVDARMSGAYIGGSAIDSPSGQKFHNLSSAQVGVGFGYRGAEFGVGYVYASSSGYNSGILPSQRTQEQWNFHSGFQYTWEAVTVGASILRSEDIGDPTVVSNRQLWVYSTGMTYRLAEDLSVAVEYNFLETLSADFPDYKVHQVLLQLQIGFRASLSELVRSSR